MDTLKQIIQCCKELETYGARDEEAGRALQDILWGCEEKLSAARDRTGALSAELKIRQCKRCKKRRAVDRQGLCYECASKEALKQAPRTLTGKIETYEKGSNIYLNTLCEIAGSDMADLVATYTKICKDAGYTIYQHGFPTGCYENSIGSRAILVTEEIQNGKRAAALPNHG